MCTYIGLQDMLHAESEWVLACLEVDPGGIEFLDTEGTETAATTESTAKDNDLFSQRDIPQPLPPPSSKKGVACSEDLSHIFSAYGSWKVKQADGNITAPRDPVQVGHRKQAKSVSTQLQAIGMPDMDICVLLTLLVEETKHHTDLVDMDRADDMLNLTAEHVTVAVKLWRLVAYCKLLAMRYCSEDKLVVADLSKMDRSQNSLNVFEFDGMEDVLTRHDLKCNQWKMDHDSGGLNVQQMSPFDAVGKFIRRLTCIAEVPFSYLQGMSFLSTNGGFMCDPWVLEPSLTTNTPSFYRALALQFIEYVKLFLLQGYHRRAQSSHLVSNHVPSQLLSPSFVPGALERIHVLSKGNNLNHILVPIELLRDYCDRTVVRTLSDNSTQNDTSTQKNQPHKSTANQRVTMDAKDSLHRADKNQSATVEYTHAQITLRFWTAYRQDGIAQTSYFNHVLNERLQHEHGNQKTNFMNECEGKRSSTHYRGKWEGAELRRQRRNETSKESATHVQTDTTTDEYALRVQQLKETNSVIDLLSLEKSFQGFTDILDSAVSEEQDTSAVPTAFSDTIGVLMKPFKEPELINTVQVALEYEPKLHHPIPKQLCVWSFAHHTPYTIQELEKLINKREIPFHMNVDAGVGALSKHYATYSEVRKRIELSILLQYSVSDSD